MAHLTDYSENALLEHMLGKTAFTMPQNFLALFSSAPTDSGGGTEISGNGYARLQMVPANWATASGGASSNADQKQWATATAQWATVTAIGAYDTGTAGGNLLWYNTVSATYVLVNTQARFAAGALTATLD